MATGDLAATGMSTADIANLIGLVSPPGSSTKNIGEEDTSTTKGGTNSTTSVDPSKIISDIGASSSTTNIGASNSTQNIGKSSSTQTIGGSTKVQTIGETNSTSTTQDHVDQAGVDRAIQQILEGSQGLAATAAGQHISGGYNSTTDMLLKNDLAARTVGTVALLNKSSTTTNHTNASTNVLTDSGSVNTLLNSGSINTTNNSGSTNSTASSGSTNTQSNSGTVSNTKTDAVTDIVKNAPYNVSTTQVAQVSGTVAAGIAAGSLVYNALGQVVSKATGALVDSVTGKVVKPAINAVSDALGLGAGVTGGASAGIIADTAASGAALDAAASAGAASTVGEVAGWDLLGSGAAASAGEGVATGAAAAGVGEAVGGSLLADGAVEAGAAAAGEGIAWGEIATTAAEILAWIICTELCKQGRLNKRWYFAGAKTFATYSDIDKIGYYIWAIPCVKHLRKYPESNLSKFLELIFNWRAEYIAHNAGVKGARKLKKGMIVSAILYPSCVILGRTLHLFGVKKDYHVIYR